MLTNMECQELLEGCQGPQTVGPLCRSANWPWHEYFEYSTKWCIDNVYKLFKVLAVTSSRYTARIESGKIHKPICGQYIRRE